MHTGLRAALLLFLLALPLHARTARSEVAAPEFTLPGRAGEVSLGDFKGKVVLVDFWASWCVPCRKSFPWMNDIAARYEKDGLVVLAVNLDKRRDPAEAFLAAFAPSFPIAFDPAGRTAEAFHVEAMPSSFLVSRTGRIVYIHQGFQPNRASDVEARIREELSK